jgi:hypothetical protein
VAVTLDVLTVGFLRSNSITRDVLLSRVKCRFVSATCIFDLFVLATNRRIDVVILLDTLSEKDLKISAEYIRRNWPVAKILMIRTQAECLEDPLYDERLLPDLSADDLLSMLDKLVTDKPNRDQSVLRK